MMTSLASRISIPLAVALVAAACSSSPKPGTSQTEQPGGGTGAGTAAGGPTGDDGGDPTTELPGRGEPCTADTGACAEGLTCISYYGIAGPAGPTFTSCETPCPRPPDACPPGTTCTTIADGPGEVCR